MKGLVDPMETDGDKETEQQKLEEFSTMGSELLRIHGVAQGRRRMESDVSCMRI